MSIELVESEIARFLSTPEPEVACITGHWGVGKTFAWNRYLREAKARPAGIALGTYSYVSLFGVNSLDDLKYAIFEQSISSADIGAATSIETFAKNATSTAKRFWSESVAWSEVDVGSTVNRFMQKIRELVRRFWRKPISYLQQVPWLKSNVGSLPPLWFLSVRETIVCLDDIERRGSNLQIRDIMGLATLLKEQKRCKVMIILNADAIADGKPDFEKYFEKVIDISLAFVPTPAECVRIALPASTKTAKLLGEYCVKLGICNIRLIKKIEGLISRIEPLLQQYEPEVFEQAIQSLTLLAWSVYEPGNAPPMPYLEQAIAMLYSPDEKKNQLTPEEANWNAILKGYRWHGFDDFDRVVLDGVRNGYFDPSLIAKHAAVVDEQAKASKSTASFTEAWSLFHDSFADNKDAVLDGIYRSFLVNAAYISVLNLNGTVQLFKDLGRSGQAVEMINHYVAVRREKREHLDFDNIPWLGDVTDPDVRNALLEYSTSLKESKSPVDILSSITERSGWNPDDLVFLASIDIGDYARLIKDSAGDRLDAMMKAFTLLASISNPTEPMQQVVSRIRQALAMIGRESPLNERRVKKYGINIGNSPPPEESVPAAE